MKITTFTVAPAPACKGVITFKTNKNLITLNFAEVSQSKSKCPKCAHSYLCSLVHPETDKILNPATPKMDTTGFPTIKVVAFTGMPIGNLPIIADTPTSITVITKKQLKLEFDKATGTQINATKPHFANRISPIDLKHPIITQAPVLGKHSREV